MNANRQTFMQIKEELKKLNEEEETLKEQQQKEELLETFLDYDGKDKVITSQEALKDIEEERKHPPKRFFSGISQLDKMLDGFREGDLIVISAPTKMGKTSLAQTFTHEFAKKDINSLWFSYELQVREFLEKFGEPIPSFVLPKRLTDNSLDWLEQRIIESIAKYGIKVVFIDHLHFLLNLYELQGRSGISLLIGGMMRELKKIAIKWNICIFIICHTTKISYDISPQLSDIRDSSFISQEADTVLMLWRLREKGSEGFTNEAKLMVRANRRTGQTGGINLVFNNNRFYEKDYHQPGISEPIEEATEDRFQEDIFGH